MRRFHQEVSFIDSAKQTPIWHCRHIFVCANIWCYRQICPATVVVVSVKQIWCCRPDDVEYDAAISFVSKSSLRWIVLQQRFGSSMPLSEPRSLTFTPRFIVVPYVGPACCQHFCVSRRIFEVDLFTEGSDSRRDVDEAEKLGSHLFVMILAHRTFLVLQWPWSTALPDFVEQAI